MARGGTLAGRAHELRSGASVDGRCIKKKSLSLSVEQIRKNKLNKLQTLFQDITMTDMANSVPVDSELVQDHSKFIAENGEVDENMAVYSRKVSSMRAFGKHLKRAVEMADVVLEVLDARDPESFRSSALESYVLENGKKLVLILNKLDLLNDPALARRWEVYLKRQHPVVLFRSMTTTSRSRNSTVKFDNCKTSMANSKQLSSGYSPIGAADLMSVLANYTRSEGPSPAQVGNSSPGCSNNNGNPPGTALHSITVCVVGMPNVGKSSIINSLLRNTKHLRTGNEPGITKKLQTVKLTNNIQLVDTPGVVLDPHVSPSDQILRGTLHDFSSIFCDQAIDKLFQDHGKRIALFRFFAIDPEEVIGDAQQFLARICDDRGLILSGGRRDLATARRLIIQTWASGEVHYSVEPPNRSESSVASFPTAVSSPSPELDLDNL